MTARKTALCLTGAGLMGGLYQVGALAALEDVLEGASFDVFVGTSSGAALAAALAGGVNAKRLYRALIDPADNFFPLERQHILSLDFDEWRRTLVAGMGALRHGFASLVARTPAPSPADLWEQLDRFYDALPAGLLTVDRYERFLSDFFFRRSVPNSFRALNRQLVIPAVDLDSGETALFGTPGLDHVPISLACAASAALPLFFSPVRIGTKFYIDGSTGRFVDLHVAAERGASLAVIIEPSVPVHAEEAPRGVPTGHGSGRSLRDKGMMWVYNQSLRAGLHARVQDAVDRVGETGNLHVLRIVPDGADAIRFLHNAAAITARREILEWAYRTSRETLRNWVAEHPAIVEQCGWRAARVDQSVAAQAD